MKLSFTTAGCPGWTFNEIFATAKDLGIKGIEIRGLGDTVYAPDIELFSAANASALREKLLASDMEIPVLDSTAALAVPECAEAAMTEAKEYVRLAARIGSRCVRVMGTPKAEPTPADTYLCEKQYRLLCEFAAPLGVTPLLETNGVLADSKVMADFMERVGCENSGVLWDIHHPYRFFGETPEQTVKNIGKYIKHTHVKDSVMADGVLTYKMMGYGDVPIPEAVKALAGIGYEGYISLEWLKRYNPSLQEPGIVFAHFASYMGFVFEQE